MLKLNYCKKSMRGRQDTLSRRCNPRYVPSQNIPDWGIQAFNVHGHKNFPPPNALAKKKSYFTTTSLPLNAQPKKFLTPKTFTPHSSGYCIKQCCSYAMSQSSIPASIDRCVAVLISGWVIWTADYHCGINSYSGFNQNTKIINSTQL